MLEQVFEVGKRVGGGSSGEVYKVRTSRPYGVLRQGQQYALKVMCQDGFRDDRIVRYAYQERDIMQAIEHPCIVRLVSAMQVEKPVAKWILVMEYCQGGSLRSKLVEFLKLVELQRRAIDESWHAVARRYSAEVLIGLEYLHSKQIVHRDLKPDNVVLSAQDHCKITDFGHARHLHQSQGNLAPASAGAPAFLERGSPGNRRTPTATNWVGTWVYTAPEVPDGHYGSPVDIFSWGVMVFELVAATDPEPPTEAGHSLDYMPHFRRQLLHCAAPPTTLALLGKVTNTVPAARGTASELQEHAFFSDVDWDRLLQECTAPDSETRAPRGPGTA